MSKPFVYLLRSPNSNYVFDVNRNEIVAVSPIAFQALQKTLIDEPIDSSEKSSLDKLKEKGYLSDNRIQEIKHPATENLPTLLKTKMHYICLQITQNCNLRCSYCIYSSEYEKQRNHSTKKMTFETGMKAIDYLWQHSRDASDIMIGFYGGEPLLEMPLIRQLIQYAENKFQGKRLTFLVTTNGVLLTPEIMKYLDDHHTKVTISLDGPENIHDTNRRFPNDGDGSFKLIMKNLNLIFRKYPSLISKMSISMVMVPTNNFDEIETLFDDYPLLKEMELTANVVDADYTENETKFSLTSEDFTAKFEYKTMLALLQKLYNYPLELVSPIARSRAGALFQDLDNTLLPTDSLPLEGAPSGPCMVGVYRLFVTADGSFFPCERVSEKSEIMNVGNLDKGVDVSKAKHLMNVAQITENECKNCWASTLCMQCFRYADGGDKLSREIRLSNCHRFLQIAKMRLQAMLLQYEFRVFYL